MHNAVVKCCVSTEGRAASLCKAQVFVFWLLCKPYWCTESIFANKEAFRWQLSFYTYFSWCTCWIACRILDSDGSGCRQPLHQPAGNPWIAPRSKATYSYHISHPVTKYGPCSSRRYKSVVCLWVSSGDLWGPLVGAISGALGDFRRYDKSRFHLLRIWFEGRHSCSYRSWRNYHWTRTTMHHLHRRRTWPCRECRCFLIVLRSSTLLLIQQTMSRWTQLRLTWRIKRRCNKRWLQEWKR